MFLPGPSIPAEPRLGSPLPLQLPAAQRPRALLEPRPSWGGQESSFALATIQALSLHSVGQNIPDRKWEFACSVWETAGVKVMFLFLPCSCPFSTSSLLATCLQKSSSVLGNGKKPELWLEMNPVLAGGKSGSPSGVSASLQILKSRWCLAAVAEKLLESARKKEQGLEKLRCWFSNPQILTCQRKQSVFCTERASEL